MKILAIGDVTEPRAVTYLTENLPRFRRENGIDFCMVNAENAGLINGPDPDQADALLEGGADILTGGNHSLQKKALHPMLENSRRLLRPTNYPPEAPGMGHSILQAGGMRILVMNAAERVNMEPADCPFHAIDRILAREKGEYDLAFLDFHAEATGEVMAMGYYLDGRVTGVFGTHTHVPTADERILPKGTAYITDIGMCGAENGILGMAPEVIIKRFLTHLPERYAAADGKICADGVIFEVDTATRRATKISRVRF